MDAAVKCRAICHATRAPSPSSAKRDSISAAAGMHAAGRRGQWAGRNNVRGMHPENGAIWQSISGACYEFPRRGTRQGGRRQEASPKRDDRRGRGKWNSMCDVLLCVILTELAAGGAFGAAENCTTIVGRENKLLHLRSTKWPG